MIFLDTNIFLRFFEQKDTEDAEIQRIEDLFKKVVEGKISCFTNTMVISEIVWVLDKYYGWGKAEVCDNIELILNTPNLKVRERSLLLKAVAIYRNVNIDFIDICNYFYMKAENSSQIYSYDNHYDRLSKLYGDLKRMVP